MQVVPIDPARAGDPDYGRELCIQLEQGNILVLRETPFMPSESDSAFLRAQEQSGDRSHKNIAYKPNRREVTGAGSHASEDVTRLKAILAKYSEESLAFLTTLFPAYAATWQVDYASFRPFEEAGRPAPLSRRNDLMHIDAFPTRPTHGGRLLRAFTNVHPSQDRVWATADPFEDLAARYAVDAGLLQLTGPLAGVRRTGRKLAHLVGVKTPDRSAYDEFMLRFHHYLKSNAEFQEKGERAQTAFEPGVTWISFTDQIAHAVRSGRYALEQTCIVPYSAMVKPERAPLAVLERLAGTRLTDQAPAAGAARAV